MKNTKLIAMVMATLLTFSLCSVSFAEESATAEALASLDQSVAITNVTVAPEIAPSAQAETYMAETSSQPEESKQAEDVQNDPTAEPAATLAQEEATPQPEQAAKSDATDTPDATATPDATDTPEVSNTPDPTAVPTESATQEPTVTESPVTRNVEISMDMPKNLKFGDTVTLTATLIGYDDVSVSLQWQYTKDGETWTDAPGANNLTYAFQVNDDTASTAWRLAVTIL